MKTNVCVCIEGEFRGSPQCGTTIKKNLIEHLDADLYFCLQKTPVFNGDNLKFYGDFKKMVVYENIVQNIKEKFNEICKEFNIKENVWMTNFNAMEDNNHRFDRDELCVCMSRMYNRYMLYRMLENTDYEWFVILRSDMIFTDLFYCVDFFTKGHLAVHDEGGWGGINNNLIVFDRSIMRNVLLYITNFLDCSLLKYMENNNLGNICSVEEKFFMYNMKINNVNTRIMKNKWYISSDNIDNMIGGVNISKYKYDYIGSRKIYYSQIGQDEYYVKNIINYKKNGVFLDIGAHDGITLSNTYYLESILGWKGICVEPNPANSEKCKINRRAILCDRAVYEKSDMMVDFIIPCGTGYVDGGIEQLCGISGKIRQKSSIEFGSQYSKKNIIQVKTININDLLDSYNMHHIDYMSLDTEGYELEILKMINYEKTTIYFLTVEHGNDVEYQQLIHDFLTNKSYIRHRINRWDDEYILRDVS